VPLKLVSYQFPPRDVTRFWHTFGMATRWWYTKDGTIVGFFDDDGQWIYRQSGETIGYVEGTWIN
jgi:hypothetical protein